MLMCEYSGKYQPIADGPPTSVPTNKMNPNVSEKQIVKTLKYFEQ